MREGQAVHGTRLLKRGGFLSARGKVLHSMAGDRLILHPWPTSLSCSRPEGQSIQKTIEERRQMSGEHDKARKRQRDTNLK